MSLELLEKLVQYVSIGKWNKLFFFYCCLYAFCIITMHFMPIHRNLSMSYINMTGLVMVLLCVRVPVCVFFFLGGGVTYWSGRSVNSAYELFNLRAQKISTLYKNYIFQCTGNICMWNLKGTLWNSTKHILPIYSEVFFFISQAKIWELLDLRPHKCFWNGAQINIRLFLWYTFGCCTIIGSIYFDMMESVHEAFYFFRTILYFLQFRSIQFIYKTNTYCYASKLF